MALDPTTGLNSYYLIQLLENLSQLAIGYDDDTDDINQDLVLQFLKEGFQTIVDADTRWPWFETNYTALVPYGQPTVISFSQVSTYSPYQTQIVPIVPINDIKELINVVAIQGDAIADPSLQYSAYGLELIYISQDQGEKIWVGSNNQPDIPGYFSLWSNKLYLWPRPNQTYTLFIRGYREPDLTWLNDSSNSQSFNYVDLDLELQACLINYTMSRIYQFQEDPEMSRVYRDQFVTNLKNYQDYLTAPSSNEPLVYSGGLQLMSYGYGLNVPGMRVLPSSTNIPSAVVW
jgi:hypothetical protein